MFLSNLDGFNFPKHGTPPFMRNGRIHCRCGPHRVVEDRTCRHRKVRIRAVIVELREYHQDMHEVGITRPWPRPTRLKTRGLTAGTFAGAARATTIIVIVTGMDEDVV